MTGVDISILTPSLNQGPFLQRCLASVARQPGVHVEHIVMDAGSTDQTTAILDRAAQASPHPIIWRSEPDRGQADALNKALAMAKGPLLGWLNVDEYYEPDVLADIVARFSAEPAAVLVYGDYRYVTPDERVIKVNRRWSYDRQINRLVYPVAQTCAMFLRTDRVRAVGGFDDSYHYVMDWELLIRVLEQDPGAIHVPRVMSNFTMHPLNKTSASPAGFENETKRLLERQLPHLGSRRRRAARAWQQIRWLRLMAREGVLWDKVAFGLFEQHKWAAEFGRPGPLDVVFHPRGWQRIRRRDRGTLR